MRTFILRLQCVLLLVGLVGCGTLDKSGPYGGDKVLYDADQTITTSAALFHAFVTWEYENRAALAKYPEIKQYADKVRMGAPAWTSTAIKYRDAYLASGAPGDKDALVLALSVLKTTVKEIATYTAKGAQ